jgi:hypothetical protein
MTRIVPALALPLVLGACAATHEDAHDPLQRQRLLDSVKALEGTWEAKSPDGQTQAIEFKVSSAGSIVREIMFPGTPHEMTNVYRLEGNSLALTHYCAMGNQPELRASARAGNQLAFGVVNVADMDAPDEMYMGGLTLEFVDKDHLNEHWSSFVKGELQKDHSVDIELTRRK